MIAVLGAGPHGRQLAALQPIAHLFDDYLPDYPAIEDALDFDTLLIGAAWPQVRRSILQRIPEGRGSGIVAFPGSQVGDDVTIGEHTHIGWNAVVSHGCRVGSCVNICPGVVLAGEVHVEDDAFIGANATVIHGGITIGHGAVIGAGAVVLRDVPPGVTVYGNPARSAEWHENQWLEGRERLARQE